MTILPYFLFDGTVRWFSILAQVWRFLQHINVQELRAELVWEIILAKAFDLRRLCWLGISDNKATTCGLGHGRSGSPYMNPVLQKRAIFQLISDGRLW